MELIFYIYLPFLVDIPNDYYFDFGLQQDNAKWSDFEILPLDVKDISITVTVGELLNSTNTTVWLSGVWMNPYSYGNSSTVFPIARMADWHEGHFFPQTFFIHISLEFYHILIVLSSSVPSTQLLTPSQQVMVTIFAVLYGIGFLLVVGLAFYERKRMTLANVLLFFFIAMTQLFRVFYIAFFTGGELQTETEVSFFLVEPPSFFVLSASSILILSYGFCFYCVTHSIPQEKVFMRFWIVWSVFTVLLYLVMVAVIALLSHVSVRMYEIVDCYGVVSYDENSDSVQNIRIAYHSLLLLFAVIATACILFFGAVLRHKLPVDYLLLISVISGVSVFCTNIMWVIYSALSASTPYFVIPLWIVECPPLIAICFLARPRQGPEEKEMEHDISNRSRSY